MRDYDPRSEHEYCAICHALGSKLTMALKPVTPLAEQALAAMWFVISRTSFQCPDPDVGHSVRRVPADCPSGGPGWSFEHVSWPWLRNGLRHHKGKPKRHLTGQNLNTMGWLDEIANVQCLSS
jgi:hypothetical protein